MSPLNQSSPNSGKRCPLARPITMQNFVAIRQEQSEINAIENLCSRKSGTKFTKKTCYLLKPSIVPNFIEIGETTLEHYNFLHPSIFWLPRADPLGQRLPVWVVGYIKPTLATCRRRSDDPSPRYLLPNSSILLPA